MRRLVAAITVVVIVASCRPYGDDVVLRTPGQSSSPVRGGRIVEGAFADAKTFAPWLANDQSSNTVSALVYDGLFTVDAKTAEIRPNLGRWTVSADGLVYSWKLEPGAVWSDGKPIVAEDYLTAVRAVARSKKTVRVASFQDIEGFDDYRSGKATGISGIKIDAADPKAFTVKFKRVFCPALTNAFGAAAGPIPTQVYGKYFQTEEAVAKLDDAAENIAPPVASGPFVFKSWKSNDQIVLDRNDSYFRGAPYLDGYVLKVVTDVTSLAAQLRSGEINFGAIEPKDLADMRKRDNLSIYTFQESSYSYIGWNTKSPGAPGLADKRVRQALAYGLDMGSVVRQVLYGQGTPVYEHHLAASWASAAEPSLNHYPYDPRKAEDLIRAAGYTYGPDSYYQKDGKRLELTMVTNSGNKVRETMLQSAVEQYKKIGVLVNPRLMQFDEMVDMLSTRSQDFAGWIIGWRLPVEPDPYGIWHSNSVPDPARHATGYNFGAYTSADVDRAIDAARTPPSGDCSQVTRKKSYEAFNRVLNDEQPYDFGFSPSVLLATTKDLHGFDPGTFGTYVGVEKWWLGH